MTSRPLYVPHFGQARCGIFCSWQFGHSDSECFDSESCARRVAVRFWECLRFGFGIFILVLSSQFSVLSEPA
jgi:hypothetical protein